MLLILLISLHIVYFDSVFLHLRLNLHIFLEQILVIERTLLVLTHQSSNFALEAGDTLPPVPLQLLLVLLEDALKLIVLLLQETILLLLLVELLAEFELLLLRLL